MEVNGELYTAAALPAEKEPLVPVRWGWVDPRASLEVLVKGKIPVSGGN